VQLGAIRRNSKSVFPQRFPIFLYRTPLQRVARKRARNDEEMLSFTQEKNIHVKLKPAKA
jgi:hypothetical protein